MRLSRQFSLWPEPAAQVRRLQQSGVRVIRARERHRLTVHSSGFGRGSILSRDPFSKLIESIAPSLIIVSNGGVWPGEDLTQALVRSSIPYINLSHCNHEGSFPLPSEAALLRNYFKKSYKALFVSQGNKTLAEAQIGQRIEGGIVRNPFAVPYDAELPWPSSGMGNSCIRFACVARLHAPSKGQDILFDALAGESWRDRDWSLSLFGEGPHKDTFERLIRIYGLENRVELCGHVSDITNVWRTHHALVLPSRYEGLPLALVEAMLCGRVVITTDVAGNREFLEDGVSGYLAAAPNAVQLRSTLERAWDFRKEWQAIGRRAQKRAKLMVPPDPVQEFADIINSALQERKQ